MKAALTAKGLLFIVLTFYLVQVARSRGPKKRFHKRQLSFLERFNKRFFPSRPSPTTGSGDPGATPGICPRGCRCNGGREVHCTFRSLTAIPDYLPADLVKLNFAYNQLASLPKRAFNESRNTLQFILLQSNEIAVLRGGELNHLRKVKVLRLSWNRLTRILRHTFENMTGLNRLHLDHNKISFIHPEAFRGLTKLTFLQLEGNKLANLHPEVFVTVKFKQYFIFSHIQYLYLSNNKLILLPQGLLSSLTSLRQIYLHGNPWQCSCEIQWMHQWIRESGKYRCKTGLFGQNANPRCALCASPANLEGENLMELPFANITCRAPQPRPPHVSALAKSFPDTLSWMELQNEAILFRYGAQGKETMTLRLDSRVGSLVLMHCEAARKPGTSTNLVRNGRRLIYAGTLELMMSCTVDYPTDQNRLGDIIRPYLNAALNFTADSTGRQDLRSREFTVQLMDEPFEPLAPLGSGRRVRSASLLESSPLLRSEKFIITIPGKRFYPETRRLALLFQNKHHFDPSASQKWRGEPWTMMLVPNLTTRKTVLAMERKIVTLQCRAIGVPRPKLSWILPNGRQILASKRFRRFRVTRSGRLVIRRAGKRDSGLYYCMSLSKCEDQAAASAGSVRLFVATSSDVNDRSAATLARVQAGQDWTVSCPVDAVPEATVAWSIPSGMLLSHNFSGHHREEVDESDNLLIQRLDKMHSGYYSCIAANRMGAVVLTTKLEVTEQDEEEGSIDMSAYEEYDDDMDIEFSAYAISVGPTNEHDTYPTSRTVLPRTSTTVLPPEPTEVVFVQPEETVGATTATIATTAKTTTHKTSEATFATLRSSDGKSPNRDSPKTTTHSNAVKQSEMTLYTAVNKSPSSATVTPGESITLRTSKDLEKALKNKKESEILINGAAVFRPEIQAVTFEVSPSTSTAFVSPALGSTSTAFVSPALGSTAVSQAGLEADAQDPSVSTETVRITISKPRNMIKLSDEAKQDLPTQATKGHITTAPVTHMQETAGTSSPSRGPTTTRDSSTENAFLATTTPTSGSNVPSQMLVGPSERALVDGPSNGVSEAAVRAKTTTTSPLPKPAAVETARTMKFLPDDSNTVRTATSPRLEPRLEADDQPHPGLGTTTKSTVALINSANDPANRPETSTSFNQLFPSGILAAQSEFGSEEGDNVDPGTLNGFEPSLHSDVVVHPEMFSLEPDLNDRDIGKTIREAPRHLQTSVYMHRTTRAPNADPQIGPSNKLDQDRLLETSNIKAIVPGLNGETETDDVDTGLLNFKPSKPNPALIQIPAVNSLGEEDKSSSSYNAYTESTSPATVQTIEEEPQDFDETPASEPKTDDDISTKEPEQKREKETISHTDVFRVLYGDPLDVKCRYNGDSENDVDWSFVASHVSDGLNHFQVSSLFTDKQSILAIERVTLMHNGTFTCRLVNDSAAYEHNVEVIVISFPPKFVKPVRKYLSIKYGHSHTITCNAQGAPKPDISWSWPRTAAAGQNAPYDGVIKPRVYTSPDNVLHIESAVREFNVMFLCTASNAVGRALHEVFINIEYEEPSIETDLPAVVKLLEGESTVLECAASGIPPPRTLWILPTGRLEATQRRGRYFVHMNGSLQIRNVTEEMAGRLSCVAENRFGTRSKELDLTVTSRSPPSTTTIQTTQAPTTTITSRASHRTTAGLTKISYEVSGYVGDDVILHCGNPPSKFRAHERSKILSEMVYAEWQLPSGEKAIFPSVVPSYRQNALYEGSLSIKPLSTNDGGVYVCLSRDKDKGPITKQVKVTLATKLLPPLLSQRLRQNVSSRRGRLASAECSVARGKPKPKVYWVTPSGDKLTPGSYMSGMYVLYSGRLVIRSLDWSFHGQYKCVAYNEAGNATRYVHFKARPFPPRIRGSRGAFRMAFVRKGANTTLPCSAIGVPEPSIYWILPNKAKVSKNKVLMDPGKNGVVKFALLHKGSLLIRGAELSDGGVYKCNAVNRMGKSTKYLRLRVYR